MSLTVGEALSDERRDYLASVRRARTALIEWVGSQDGALGAVDLARRVCDAEQLPAPAVRAALWELLADRALVMTPSDGLVAVP